MAVYNDTTLPGETFTGPAFNFVKETQVFFDAVPVRYSGMHYCLQTKGQNLALNNVLVSMFLNGLPQYARVRTRIHYGSIMELQYQLQSYGIPLSTIPFGVHGNSREDILNVWFNRHLKETNQSVRFHQAEVAQSWSHDTEVGESVLWNHHVAHGEKEFDAREALVEPSMWASTAEEGGDTAQTNRVKECIKPTGMDVLFGKGYRLQLHPGNVRFRKILEQHKDNYESTPRQSRREMAVELAQILRNNGVRFLQKAGSGTWVESEIAQAEKKVTQYFRELRKKRSKGAGDR